MGKEESGLRLQDALRTLNQTVPVRIAGRVTELTGLVLRATAPGARVGELVLIEPLLKGVQSTLVAKESQVPPLLAEVVGFRGEEVVLLPLGPVSGIGPDSVVRPLARPFAIRCGPALLGRVLNGLGEPIDQGPSLTPSVDLTPFLVVRSAPDPLRRKRVNKIFPLGIKAIDGCLTLGEGQRIGVFSGPGLGKSTLLGQVARQAEVDVVVIGLVGERGREVREFIDGQLDEATRRRAVVVCATSDQPPLLRLKAALSATAVAEHFREQGKRVLLLMDSLTRVARAQREVGLAAGEMPARQGYPPSVFALLPALLERAGQAEEGSITALYAVLTTSLEEDPDDIIAEEARATLDGHITLSHHLAERGHYPAVDVLRSLSRVMDDVVDSTHRRAASRVREVLAICERQRELIALGAYQKGVDPRTDEALQILGKIESFMQQDVRQSCELTTTLAKLRAIFEG